MQDVLKNPYGPLPRSITTPDGAPAKIFNLQYDYRWKAENLIKSSPFSWVTSFKKNWRDPIIIILSSSISKNFVES